MAKYPFLSDEWVDEARKIREEYEGQGRHHGPPDADEPGHHRGALRRRRDRRPPRHHRRARWKLETGHIDPVDLKVTLDYATAKAILVEGNPQVGMQAFMAGKIKVEGDMAKLMMLQRRRPTDGRRGGRPAPGHHRLADRPPEPASPTARRSGDRGSPGRVAGPRPVAAVAAFDLAGRPRRTKPHRPRAEHATTPPTR